MPEIPPRPQDPLGAAFWDVCYGPGSQATPFGAIGQQIEGLKQNVASMVNVSKSMDDINKTLKESNNIMRETNATLRLLVERLK